MGVLNISAEGLTCAQNMTEGLVIIINFTFPIYFRTFIDGLEEWFNLTWLIARCNCNSKQGRKLF